MLFQLNFKSGKPAYLQIVDQVKYAAASGGLLPGESLPSIRPLAEKLRVNRNTVAKAYSELESQGVTESRPGKGCFLSANHSPLKKAVQNDILRQAIDEAIVQAHHFQIPRDTFIKTVTDRLDQFEKQSHGGK